MSKASLLIEKMQDWIWIKRTELQGLAAKNGLKDNEVLKCQSGIRFIDLSNTVLEKQIVKTSLKTDQECEGLNCGHDEFSKGCN